MGGRQKMEQRREAEERERQEGRGRGERLTVMKNSYFRP